MKAKKILIIEDSVILLEALKEKLSETGTQIITAEDGESGLRLAKQESPDLILLDLVIPKIDGIRLLTEIKHNKNTKKIPVLILTNLSQGKNEQDCRKLGASEFFLKTSTNLNKLLKIIKKYLK